LGGSVDNTGGKQSTPSMIAINFMPESRKICDVTNDPILAKP
jgi:hypothetical protein